MGRTVISDGSAEDLVRAFVQVGCAENHAKTLLEKFTAQLENGIIDPEDSEAVEKQVEKIEDITEEIDLLAELRRCMMLRLLDSFDGDKDFWCMAKHLGVGAYTAFEAYQASGDTELLALAEQANRRFVKAMTRFLGVEITECASCFSDILKAQKGDINGDKL